MFSPTNLCEQAIGSYINANLSGSASVYTGIDNADKVEAPAVIVYCRSANEVVFGTRNYAFDVDIQVKDMASDTTEAEFSNVAGNVAALFSDSVTGSAALNAYFATTTQSIALWQIIIQNYTEDHNEDAWIDTFSFRFIGAPVNRA
jgi:hypothetical protein